MFEEEGNKMFTVCYTCENIETAKEIHYNRNYRLLDNANFMAKLISECEDVIYCVDVIDAFTGEIMTTYKYGDILYKASLDK